MEHIHDSPILDLVWPNQNLPWVPKNTLESSLVQVPKILYLRLDTISWGHTKDWHKQRFQLAIVQWPNQGPVKIINILLIIKTCHLGFIIVLLGLRACDFYNFFQLSGWNKLLLALPVHVIILYYGRIVKITMEYLTI